jgi:hypothetical protein
MQHLKTDSCYKNLLFKEEITGYFDTHMKPLNILCGKMQSFSNVEEVDNYCYALEQRCTNPRYITMATTFSTVARNICGSSVWNVHHVSLLALRICRWLLRVLEICAPLL